MSIFSFCLINSLKNILCFIHIPGTCILNLSCSKYNHLFRDWTEDNYNIIYHLLHKTVIIKTIFLEQFLQWSIHKPGREQKHINLHSGASLPFLSSGASGSKEIPHGNLFALDSEGQYILTCDRYKGVIYKVR